MSTTRPEDKAESARWEADLRRAEGGVVPSGVRWERDEAEHIVPLSRRRVADTFDVPEDLLADPPVPIRVRKLSAYVPVSCCVLTDETGENHCDHPPAPKPPLRQRLRWRTRGWWSSLRYRLGSRIAGVDLDREEEL